MRQTSSGWICTTVSEQYFRTARNSYLTPIATGISKISKEQAQLLPHPTLAIPGTDEYLVQLDVFHELHCLDDLRKMLYPERFPGLEELKDENGVIDRETHAFLHWGMLSAVADIPFLDHHWHFETS